jgi:hypothetical protein
MLKARNASPQGPPAGGLPADTTQSVPGTASGETPVGGGGDITIPDTLADSLANAAKHMRSMLEGDMPMPREAVPELQVFGQLLAALGERDQGAAQGPPGGPGGLPQAGPGASAPAQAPGPPGLPQGV